MFDSTKGIEGYDGQFNLRTSCQQSFHFLGFLQLLDVSEHTIGQFLGFLIFFFSELLDLFGQGIVIAIIERPLKLNMTNLDQWLGNKTFDSLPKAEQHKSYAPGDLIITAM
jgi:hypothetical protein